MSRQKRKDRHEDEDAFARARDEGEPGAHSGSESQAHERTVPGTASAREGYHRAGTGSGEPLKGVRTGEDRPAREGEAGDGSGQRRRGGGPGSPHR
ncbi:hypothetical protein ABZ924_20530 [Streptomyces sp. NPDC046876]|uniref:hypothetical protein n=1 Tax=Streptomyces sp. NPDC046876 TaxID=3155616 RepID=UPI0033CA4FAE